MGDTAISAESIGAPLRLAYDQDGTPKFGKTGRPVVRVVKEVADTVRLIRENFVANLAAYSHSIAKGSPDDYKAQVLAAQEAGRPIVEHDRAALVATMAEPATEPATEPAAEPAAEPAKGKAKEAVAA
jgi:hypothetical protein